MRRSITCGTLALAGALALTLAGCGALTDDGPTLPHPAPLRIAEVVATPSSGTAPLAVTFTGQIEHACDPCTCDWDFGDGCTACAHCPTHVFATPGDYTVAVRVVDAMGNEDTHQVAVHVDPQPGVGPGRLP